MEAVSSMEVVSGVGVEVVEGVNGEVIEGSVEEVVEEVVEGVEEGIQHDKVVPTNLERIKLMVVETSSEVVVEAFDQAIGPTISTSSDPTTAVLFSKLQASQGKCY